MMNRKYRSIYIFVGFLVTVLICLTVGKCITTFSSTASYEHKILKEFRRWNRRYGKDRGITDVSLTDIRNINCYGKYTDPDYPLYAERNRQQEEAFALLAQPAEKRAEALRNARNSLSELLSSSVQDGFKMRMAEERVKLLESLQGELTDERKMTVVKETDKAQKRVEFIGRGEGRLIEISYHKRKTGEFVTKTFVTPSEAILLYEIDEVVYD